MRIGSLFSGIGGLELGLEWAGLGPTVWQVERDPACLAWLETHWPEAERFDDVCTVGKHNLAPVDLICGGFPCQDVSVAGKGAGLAGERSGLWREFARIVSELRPRWVVVENVEHGAKRWVDPVVRALEKLSYASLLVPVSAFDCGANHERKRVFVVAANALSVEVRDLKQWVPSGRSAGQVRTGREAVALDDGQTSWWHDQPDLLRVADGFPVELDEARWKALGNAVVPECAQDVGWIIRELEAARPES